MLKKIRINSVGDFFVVVLSVTIITSVICKKISNEIDRNEVLKDYEQTVGMMVSYYKIGNASRRSLTYKYLVNGKYYTRKISPQVDFSPCNKNFELCSDKRFVVIYSRRHPYKSLIDLHHEIIYIEDINIDLDDFK
jgi:hypothetical protein